MNSINSIQLAYEFVLYIIMGIIIGYFLSNYYDNNIFIVIGFLLGVLMAFLRVVKLIRNKVKRK
ncbi:AtpZ/AtpI family protein [Methanothermococcus sp.]|uniref:AtpZ/AtpI family protein n=1 Tax=Methanothermococcus sp. TaxID=2614238 RepID=UPI0025F023BB|nr:AtpZ/AtpI family protein [Methanothermococcus sp.]